MYLNGHVLCVFRRDTTKKLCDVGDFYVTASERSEMKLTEERYKCDRSVMHLQHSKKLLNKGCVGLNLTSNLFIFLEIKPTVQADF